MSLYWDLMHRTKHDQLTDPANATATVTSGETDLAGYEGLTCQVSYGESADTLSGSLYWTAKLQESDTSGASFTDVAAADVVTNEATAANSFGLVNAAAEDDASYYLGYKGNKRYVRVVVTATGSHSSGTPIAIFAHKEAKKQPVTNAVNP
jgi:hypothetical protein